MSGSEPDSPGNPGPYMTQVACLKVHMKLEGRLTKLEAIGSIQLIATVGTFVTILYYLWRLGVGG